MATDKFVDLMKKFDFKEPLQIKIIFEDDDDNEDEKHTDVMGHTETNQEDLIVTTENQTHKIVREPEHSIEKDIKPEIDTLVDNKKYPTSSKDIKPELVTLVDSKKYTSSSPSAPCNTVIKIENDVDEEDDIICLENYETFSTEYEKPPSIKIQTTNTPTIFESNLSRKRKLEVTDSSEPESTVNHLNKKNDTLALNTQNNATPQANPTLIPNNAAENSNSADVLGIYISNLLTSLSDNIIKILDTYQVYSTVKHDKRATPIQVNTYKDWFIRSKWQYFNLSYSTVTNIILPQEHNCTFINCFLADTVNLATKLKKPYQLERQIKPVLKEIIEWTKQKQNYKNTVLPNHSNLVQNNPAGIRPTQNNSAQCHPSQINTSQTVQKNPSQYYDPKRYPSLESHLTAVSQPATGTNTTLSYNVPNKGNRLPQATTSPNKRVDLATNKDQREIFSTGPPSRRISITISPSILQTYTNPKEQAPTTSNPLAIENEDNVILGNVINQQQTNPFPTNINRHNQYQRYDNQKASTLRNYRNQNPKELSPTTSNPLAIENEANVILGNVINHQQTNPFPMNINKQNQSQRYDNQKDFTLLNYRNQTNWNSNFSFQSAMYPTQNPTEGVNALCQNQSPRTGGGPAHPQISEQHLLNTEGIRSASTDSGFASPLYFSNQNETITDKEYSERIQPTQPSPPVIAHVTSMNPAAVSNLTGLCHVCGTSTKQMCIGCYTRYYCSNSCQRADWNFHRYACYR